MGQPMSWLRMDDGYTSNPKVARLSDRDFRIWARLLCHCSRLQDPTVDDGTVNEVSGMTKKTVTALAASGLLDAKNGHHIIHDWYAYNGTVEDRVSWFLEANPDATANDVYAAVNGKREQVLAEVKRYRNDSQVVPDTPEQVVPGNQDSGGSQEPEKPPGKGAESGSGPLPLPLNTVEANASTALVLVGTSSRTLVGEFVDDARSRQVDVPRRVIGQVAQAVKQLLDEGIEPVRVRAGLSRMLDRGRVIPSSLPNFVMEACLPSSNGNGLRYGRGNSAARIIAETRGLA